MTKDGLGGDDYDQLRGEIDDLRDEVERLKSLARAEEIIYGAGGAPAPERPERPKLRLIKGGAQGAIALAPIAWLWNRKRAGVALVTAGVAAVAAVVLTVWRSAPEPEQAGRPPESQTTAHASPTSPTLPTVAPTPSVPPKPVTRSPAPTVPTASPTTQPSETLVTWTRPASPSPTALPPATTSDPPPVTATPTPPEASPTATQSVPPRQMVSGCVQVQPVGVAACVRS